MANAGQHFTLRVCVFDLFHFDHLVFVEDLDSVESAIMLGADQMDSPKGARAESDLAG